MSLFVSKLDIRKPSDAIARYRGGIIHHVQNQCYKEVNLIDFCFSIGEICVFFHSAS